MIANVKIELEKAIMERYKQELERRLSQYVELVVFEKYKGTKIKNAEWEYELFAVKCNYETTEESIAGGKVEITLYYSTTSQLTKEQKKQLKQLIANWNKHKHMQWYDEDALGVRLFVRMDYEQRLDEVISNDIIFQMTPTTDEITCKTPA